MAGKYNIEKLELNSQVQLLSKIQYLMRFSSNLLQVVGESGAGKTWLSESYLEKWASEPTQALLLCNPNQDDAQHRAIILRQLGQDGTFNQEESLVKNLTSMLNEDPIHALVVIDDAEFLSANLVKELWQLICVAQERVGWQINLLLFSKPSKLNKTLQKIAKHQKEQPIEMEIAPLTGTERELLTSAIIDSFELDSTARRAFKMRVQDVPSFAGNIIDCAYPKISPGPAKKPRSMFIPITVTVLLLILSLTLLFWLQIPRGMSPGEYLAQLWKGMTEETQPEVNKPKIDFNALAKEDAVPLPELPQDSDLAVGNTEVQEKKSVVVDSDVVDAMLDEQDQNTADEEIENSLEQSIVDVGTQKALDSIGEIPLANQVLLSIPGSRYALQLGAFDTEEELRAFMYEHDLQGRVLVYETIRSGSSWYMVLLGDYPSADEAKRTEAELPASLRRLGPWAKSFTQIHKEINQVQ